MLEILEVFRPALLHWRFQLSYVHEIPEITVWDGPADLRFGQSHTFSQLPVMRCFGQGQRKRSWSAILPPSKLSVGFWQSPHLWSLVRLCVYAFKRAKWRPPTPVINTVPSACLPWHDSFTSRRHVEDTMTLVLSRIALLLTPAVTCDSKIHVESASLASTSFCCMES